MLTCTPAVRILPDTMDLLREFEKEQIATTDRPRLKAGDSVRVEMKVTEGDKTRVQAFEGVVLGIRGSGPSTTFTVRRETGSFAVERIFPLYSPLITVIEVIKRQKVRRARLNYLRHAGRRKFKEDVLAMQRLVKEEAEKKRLAEDAAKKEAEAKITAERQAKKEADTSEVPASAESSAEEEK